MQNPFLMRRRQRLGQRASNLYDSIHRKAIHRNQAIERRPLNQFHGEKVDALGFFHRVERDHIGMVECGDGARFALEAGQPLGIAGYVRRQDLERHLAPQLGVRGTIHLTHSANSECGVNPIVCERSSDQIELPCIGQLEAPRP